LPLKLFLNQSKADLQRFKYPLRMCAPLWKNIVAISRFILQILHSEQREHTAVSATLPRAAGRSPDGRTCGCLKYFVGCGVDRPLLLIPTGPVVSFTTLILLLTKASYSSAAMMDLWRVVTCLQQDRPARLDTYITSNLQPCCLNDNISDHIM
jgi:hypothetical protein